MTTGVVDVGWRRSDAHRADKEGELLSVPLPLSYLWLVLGVLTVLEALNDLFGVAGPSWLYDNWIHNVILAICAVLVLARAAYEPIARPAWLAFGMALLLWSVGSIGWAVAYAGQSNVPYPSFADIFWLAWYPLLAIGMFHLIRLRVPQFELHRWMDGIAVTLLVLAAGFVLVIQPATEHKTVGTLATVVVFGYPILDVLLIGAVLGVYGLLGWKPDAMWLLIGCAIVSTSIADAVFAIQEADARAVVSGNNYDFIWTAGALLFALAAWAACSRGGAQPGGRDGNAGCCVGPLRAGAGHRHSALRSVQRGGPQRAGRHHRRAGGRIGADHPDQAAEAGRWNSPRGGGRPRRLRPRPLRPRAPPPPAPTPLCHATDAPKRERRAQPSPGGTAPGGDAVVRMSSN